MNSIEALEGVALALNQSADFRAILDALPAAVYTTDPDGIVTYYNQAASRLVGRTPEVGKDRWCVSWKLYRPDGSPLPHDQCPMAMAIRQQAPVRDIEVIAERPNGERVPVMPFPTPLYDAGGCFIGALNLLVEIGELKKSQGDATARLSEQGLLHQLTERLHPAGSLEQVYDAALDAICGTMGCPRASILLFDAAGEMRFVASRGLSETYQRAVEGHSPWRQGDRDAAPILVGDIAAASDLTDLRPTISAEGIGALAFIPLISRGAVIGKFMAYYDRPHRFTPLEESLGVNIARQLALAIERKSAEAELIRQKDRVEALNRVARGLSRDLDIERILQEVTDAATELSGAKFGAFFYNHIDHAGERYVLYSLSGAPRSAFERFGLPRNTDVFEPTFHGRGIVRSDDIRIDPRYGRSAPHYGMPKGHLPVVSYLAVPVKTAAGEVLGGLFFGHDQPAVFDDDAEKMVAAIASQAAVAIDNARLLDAAHHELERRRQTEDELRQNTERLRLAMKIGKVGLWDWDVVNDRTTWTDTIYELHGVEKESYGANLQSWLDSVHPEDRPQVEERLARTMEEGAPYEVEFRNQRPDGSTAWIYAHAALVGDADGPRHLIGATLDITERKENERQRDLLVAELNHRVKNTLATVVSIARQSFSAGKSLEEARTSFEGRVQALAHTHSRLAAANWDGVPLDAVLNDELAPYLDEVGSNARLDGPHVTFGPKAAVTVGMAIHELATNAAKYGALSTKSGHVEVSWELGEEAVTISWREHGGPAVVPPQRTGFGRLLLERAVAADLGGEVVLEFAPEGLACKIVVPSARNDVRR